MPEVKMVTTGDLFAGNYKFVLPAYQRGYRWRTSEKVEDSQVLQLLEDIEDYRHPRKKYEDKFYCMQPIVVAPAPAERYGENAYYLVDGQQRLTTFFLLYRYIKFERIGFLVYRDKTIPEGESKGEETLRRLNNSMFSLAYENRDEIGTFLDSIQNIQGITDATIDKYFLSSAYDSIRKWFQKLDGSPDYDKVEGFERLLARTSDKLEVTDDQHVPPSLQFIWYELDAAEVNDQERLFQRINKGKLPLTSAELIKAFLFGEFDRAERQGSLADHAKDRFEKEWEEYENAMQDESFWYFISRDEYDTRIEYLFELALGMSSNDGQALCRGQNGDNPQHTFYLFKKHYDKTYKNNGGIEQARKDFFEHYQKLRKYYRDWELYHLVGCLIHLGMSMVDICRDLQDKHLISEASGVLRRQILRMLFPDQDGKAVIGDRNALKTELGKLNYSNQKPMRNVLFVFNIATILGMKQRDVFFAFDQYCKSSWDLEHICSQNQEIYENKQDQWLNSILDHFLGTAFVPPPKGTESSQEAEKRNKNNATIYEKHKNGILESENTFRGILENRQGIPEKRDDLKNCILCGIVLVKDGILTKGAAWNTIFDLVNRYERNGAAPPDPENSLNNITLLDAGTNRAYKDAPFFVKRKYVLTVEGNGRFILPGTRNVFLKVYSNALDNMLFWDPKKDGDVYFDKIEDTLSNFFQLKEETDHE